MLCAVKPQTLDHVALWVADRDRIADFVTGGVGMHIVDRDRRVHAAWDRTRGEAS